MRKVMFSRVGLTGRHALVSCLVGALMVAGFSRGVMAGDTGRPAPIPVKRAVPAGTSTKDLTSDTRASAEPTTPPPAPGTPGVTPEAAPGAEVPADAPKMVLEKTFHDFGDLFKEDAVSTKIKYSNQGKTALQGIEFRPSCGCTAATGYKTSLNPGESGEVELTFNPKGRPGKNVKTVSVMSNDPAGPQSIRFEANFVPLVQVNPTALQFGTVVAGSEGKAYLTITCRDAAFNIKSIEINNPLITALTTDDDVKSTDPNYPGRHVIEFKLSNTAPTGPLSAEAVITVLSRMDPAAPDAPKEIKSTVAVIAHVLGDLVVEPRFIRVAQAFPNEKFEEGVFVTSASGKPFNITSAEVTETTLPGVSTRWEKYDNSGIKGYRLFITGTGSSTIGMFRGQIELKTDLPNESPAKIQFNGFVREKGTGAVTPGANPTSPTPPPPGQTTQKPIKPQ